MVLGDGPLHSTARLALQRPGRDKALGAAFLLATDARGRVLARIGQDEAVYRDALDGWPLVSDALRGYRLGDLWLWQGTLYRVAAAPGNAAARDPFVGAGRVAHGPRRPRGAGRGAALRPSDPSAERALQEPDHLRR